jgi:hypothetical protein
MAEALSHHYLPWVVGFGYAIVLGHVLVSRLSRQMTSQISLEQRGPKWQPGATGMTERTLFVAALLTSNGAFIGVWLALKSVAGWSEWTTPQMTKKHREVPGRAIFVNFMIGSGASIAVAAAGAYATFALERQDPWRAALLLIAAGLGVLALTKYIEHAERYEGEAGQIEAK